MQLRSQAEATELQAKLKAIESLRPTLASGVETPEHRGTYPGATDQLTKPSTPAILIDAYQSARSLSGVLQGYAGTGREAYYDGQLQV